MDKREILEKLNNKQITIDEAAALLKGTRKLRGVEVSEREMEAYQGFVQHGNFRTFITESGAKGTADAQAKLGKCARATYEKLSDSE